MKVQQFTWKVGGQQGEGVESTGEIFSVCLNRLGYHLYSYRHFSSRIKGGHTNNKVRVSVKPVQATTDEVDILVAFDQETIDVNCHELNKSGLIIADAKAKPSIPEDCIATLVTVPFTDVAKDIGTPLMKNMVAIGASAAVLGIEPEHFLPIITDTFASKGEKIIEQNSEALKTGYILMKEMLQELGKKIQLEEADGKRRMLMIGNEAIGLGAITAGVRFMPGYPITPASDIMEYLIAKLPDLGGAVIQTEDEISAIMMAIGANYAGARSLTASSGPGLSLMMEGIGLSGMTETPLVIVDTQRGGPSTGLPTKQEQSDLLQMIYGTHGEIPKIVLAPSTAEEAFYDTVEAFNLADQYQCPVILLSDLQLSLAKQTVEPVAYDKVTIDRGKVLDRVEEDPENKTVYFKRYAMSDDGISPRVLPGTENGIHHVTGLEHDEEGRPNETSVNRQKQMDKRMKKLANFAHTYDRAVAMDIATQEAELLIIGFNSTRGAIEEAIKRLRADGIAANHVHVRLVHPFPKEALQPYVDGVNNVLVVEHNATGQLASLVKMNVGSLEKIHHCLKYNGDPFYASEIYDQAKELLRNEQISYQKV